MLHLLHLWFVHVLVDDFFIFILSSSLVCVCVKGESWLLFGGYS